MSNAKLMAPLPILLIIASFLCPTELSLYIAGLRLPPHRVALILLLPVAIARLMTRHDQRLRAFDYLFIVFGLWTIGAYASHTGKDGFVYGGSLALEALGGYFVARAFVRTGDELRATMRAFVTAIVIAALFALPEALFGQIYTHDLLRQLTGYHHPIGIETRLGLTRAYGTFDHPIHYGTFCAALLALFWYAERRTTTRRINAGTMTLATFLGLSSAPMLCLGLQGGMLLWDRVTRRIKSRMTITLTALVGLYIGMSAFSNRSPIAFIATGMTLDPWTGFYRLQIWEAGMQNVWANPWTGIGLGDWERPWWMVSDTVDAFWLVIAMRQGIPAFLLLAIAIILLARAVLLRRHRHVDENATRVAIGWMMTVIALSLIGATVHYWNVLHAFFFFVLGLGGWIADPARSVAASFAVRKVETSHSHDRRSSDRKPQPERGRPYPIPSTAVAPYGRPYRAAP